MSDEFVFIKPTEKKSEPKTQTFTPDAASESGNFIFVAPPKPEDKRKGSEMAEAAGAGAAVGALSRYKGVEASGKFLKPGEGVFAPNEKQLESINATLRAKTGDPKVDVRGMSPEQVNRLLSGGEGDTLGTTGRQRTESFNLETSRRSRVQKFMEDMVNKLHPGTPDPLVSVGEPVVELKSGIEVPQSVATKIATEQAGKSTQNLTAAQQAAQRAGMKAGLAKVGQGALGGALTGAQAYNMATQPQPIDWTQYLSLLGNMGVTFGGPRMGVMGGLAQIPYAVKHREEIARGMGLGEINPTAFGGAPEALETPINSALGRR
jgi:hypothetical protein